MSVEMKCLFAAMVLGLVHLTAASFAFKAQVGNRYRWNIATFGLVMVIVQLVVRLGRTRRDTSR